MGQRPHIRPGQRAGQRPYVLPAHGNALRSREANNLYSAQRANNSIFLRSRTFDSLVARVPLALPALMCHRLCPLVSPQIRYVSRPGNNRWQPPDAPDRNQNKTNSVPRPTFYRCPETGLGCRKMIYSGHAQTIASIQWRICLLLSNSCGGTHAHLRQDTGL